MGDSNGLYRKFYPHGPTHQFQATPLVLGRLPKRPASRVAPAQDAGHAAAVVPLATFRKIQRDFPNDSMGYSIQWIGLRENLQETMVFTIKLIGVSG